MKFFKLITRDKPEIEILEGDLQEEKKKKEDPTVNHSYTGLYRTKIRAYIKMCLVIDQDLYNQKKKLKVNI